MKKNIFKNMTVEVIIEAMESKFFNIFKRYDLGNLKIDLTYIKKPDIWELRRNCTSKYCETIHNWLFLTYTKRS